MLNNLVWALLILVLIIFTNISTIITAVTPDPLVYYNLPIGLDKRFYRFGDPIMLNIDRCVNSREAITITSTRHFVNIHTLDVIAIGSDFRVIPPGCSHGWSTFTGIFPEAMLDGEYILEGQAVVHMKLLTTNLIDENVWYSEPFFYRK